MKHLTVLPRMDYAYATVDHSTDGFGRPCKQGAEVERHQALSFFYALTVMVGGVMGSLRACRVLAPVDQPVISSTALSLVAPAGGLKPQARSQIMNTSNVVPLRTQTKQIPFTVPVPSRDALLLSNQYTELSGFLRAVIDYILADFYTYAKPTDKTAAALRILAAKADRLAEQLESRHV